MVLPRSVPRHARAAFGKEPEHTRRNEEKDNAPTPPLERRRARRLDVEAGWQIERFDMTPPGIEIVDHKLHHAILSTRLLVIILENERGRAGFEDRDVAVEQLREAERLIEALAYGEILRRKEGPYRIRWRRNAHARFLLVRSRRKLP